MMIREIPDLPLEFVEALEKKGYQTLYPPQKDAIDVGVSAGKEPTSRHSHRQRENARSHYGSD